MDQLRMYGTSIMPSPLCNTYLKKQEEIEKLALLMLDFEEGLARANAQTLEQENDIPALDEASEENFFTKIFNAIKNWLGW